MKNLKSLKVETEGGFVVTHSATTFSLTACKIDERGKICDAEKSAELHSSYKAILLAR